MSKHRSTIRTSPEGADRFGRRALALLCGALLVGLLWSGFTVPNVTGSFDDDAVYQVTASALAGGHGYVRLDRPGTPHQTKYPPVYPALLAPFWKIGGGYPANIAWLRLPAILTAVLSVWFGVRYAARWLGLPRGGVVVLALMCATLPELRLLTLVTMSEWPFAALAFVAVTQAERAATDESRWGAAALAAGTAAGLAYLTRTIGITVVAAVIGWLLWKRRPRAACLAAAPAVVSVAGWMWWTHWMAAHEAGLRASPLLQYDLAYSAWRPGGLGDLLQVAKVNLGQFAIIDSQLLLRLPAEWVTRYFQSGYHGAWFWHGLAWGLVALVVAGFVSSARTRLSAAHVFLAMYAGVVLFWPFSPNRFVIPVYPLVAAFALCGWGWLIDRLQFKERRRGAVEMSLAIALGAATLMLNVSGQESVVSVRGPVVRIGGQPFDLEALQETAGWLTRETPARAVVACARSSVTWLASGRTTVMLTLDVNPVAYFYSRNRTLLDFYLRPTPDQLQTGQADAAGLLEIYQALGVTHVVRTNEDDPLFAGAFDARRQEHPERFMESWKDARAGVRIWRGPSFR